jgi:hypothetical protein
MQTWPLTLVFGPPQKGKKEKELEKELEQASAEISLKEIQRLVCKNNNQSYRSGMPIPASTLAIAGNGFCELLLIGWSVLQEPLFDPSLCLAAE